MEFRLLGPVEALVDGEPVQLGGRQRRMILSILLVQLGTAVSTDRLVEELWGGRPPETARKTVQAHIAHLRKALNVDGEVLAAAAGGYVIHADPDKVDARRFEEMVGRARALRSRDPEGASRTYKEALSGFSGMPLAGLADNAFSLRVEASRLEELRQTAVEELIDARMAAGEDAALIPELERLVAESPLRERQWALLMQALYRAGRQAESLAAYGRARRILAEELGIEPSLELRDLEQRILEQDATLNERVVADAIPAVRGAVSRNPYKGLRPFDEVDAPDFYGREALVRRLVERIDSRPPVRLITLTGPSGAGKSSAVRAGLIPALRHRDIEVTLMYPGSDPLTALAKAVAEISRETPDEVRERLANADPGIRHSVVVVVDQFEELFTVTEDPTERVRFLDLMARHVTSGNEGLWFVVTLRADFLGRLLSHPSLAPLLEASMILVPPLTDREVRTVILEPSATTGVEVEPELISALVGDVISHPTPLPLLQFVLADLFDRRRGAKMTLEAYEGMGRVSGALSRRAEEIHARLDTAGQEAVRQIFFRLASSSDGGRYARRQVTRDELDKLPVEEASVARVVDDFGRHRLLTFDQDANTGAAVVEIAHESLLTEWPRLKGWIDAAAGDLVTRETLANGASEWIGAGREASYLLRGSRLSAIEDWSERTSLVLTSDEQLFLDESRRREVEMERQRSTRRRIVAGILTGATLISLGFAVFAFTQQREAQTQAQVAEENARLARARELAAASVANLVEDPQRAILLALESARITRAADEGVIREAEEALHRAILESRLEVIITPEGESGVVSSVAAVFSPDDALLAVGAADGITRIYDSATGAEADRLVGHVGAVIDVKWSSDGSQILTVSFDGTARLWDSTTAEEEVGFGPVGARALIGSFSPDDARLVFSSDRGVHVFDATTGDELLTIDISDLSPVGVAFDPLDGARIAVAAEGPGELGAGVIIFDSQTGDELTRMVSDDGACELRWSPDGTRIATASADTTGSVWDAATGELLTRFDKHHSFLCTVDFSPDGTTVVTGGDDGKARVWDAQTAEQLVQLSGHEERVGFVSFSHDGTRVATSSDDDRIRIWDVSPQGRHEILSVFDPVNLIRASYSPDGESFLGASFTGNVYIWDATTGDLMQTLRGHDSWVYAAAYGDGGSKVVTASRDFSARVFDVATGEESARFDAPLPPTAVALSPDGGKAAVGTIAGTVHLWDLETRDETMLVSFEDEFGQVFGIDFSPEGSLLAAGGEFAIRFWDGTGEELDALAFSEDSFHGVQSLEFTDDGERFLTAHRDGTVRVWDVARRALIRQLEGHRGLVWDATFSPDEALIASAGFDGTVRLWRAATGEEILRLSDEQSFTSVDFDPLGRRLLVSGDFGARVLVVPEEDLVKLAETRLLRWWTPEECFQYLGMETCPQAPPGLDD